MRDRSQGDRSREGPITGGTNPPGLRNRIPRVTENERKPAKQAKAAKPAKVLFLLGALSGALAGFAALAVAEAVAGAVRPQAGPVVAVGGAAIDRTPAAVKDWAIRHFGTNDKLFLQLGILAVLALFALALGIVALRFRRTGATGVLLFGVVGALAATSRPDSTSATDALPSVAGATAGAVLLYVLAGRLTPRTPAPDGPPSEEGWDRRGFVIAAGAAAVASAGAGLLGRSLSSAGGQDAVASRRNVVLPRPGSPARLVPRGAGLRIPGVSPFITPNGDFYRVDTALVVPKVNATTWRLRIHGKGVTRPRVFSYDDLLRRELIERDITLTCVSNEVGGPYVGNARWIGVRLADLLAECGVKPPAKGGPADQLVARSVDGMTIGSPVEDVMDGRDALLALGMNGKPLPFAHGFPVRMVVPGLYGFVSACKWIKAIELTTFDAYDPYWVKRGWARRAPIKTESRIDTPKPFARPGTGTVMVAGVAWAQHRGIGKVEVRVDDGLWQEARLAAEDTSDTWRQWSFPWRATKGGHTLTVRATDRTGALQTEKRAHTIPDGASGWHSVVVTVD
ncbi:molybdopterin-dependent oxidoreductase [Streptomyces sp. NPDC101776]|uniref:molybdopterin-dependent oxidoreductase n=1 Tax=Streptomyces sp. NPDC101776 TaxID=3366146 RepID=UPI0038165A14